MKTKSPSNSEEAALKTRAGNRDWSDAISLWLSTRRSAATRRAYARALEDLLSSCNALPWDITRTDVMRWVQRMEAAGLAAATIAQRLAGVSSFYRFTMQDYYVGQSPLHHLNPAAGSSLRPVVEMYGKAAWLSPDESKVLLRSIWKGSLVGQRDYALFLGYILLARRNTEWRTVKWGAFERHGDLVQLRWNGKGKVDQRLDVPLPAWNAVCEYLRAAGKLEHMQAGDYIFTSIGRKGKPIPSGGACGQNSPLSSHEVGRLLKRYLRVAGIEPRHITPHSLRHTGAMLRKEAGMSDLEIMEFLGHRNLATTQVYLHALVGNQDTHWMRVSELLGLDIV